MLDNRLTPVFLAGLRACLEGTQHEPGAREGATP